MEMEIVKPNRTFTNFGFLDKKYKDSYINAKDTIEIDFPADFDRWVLKNHKNEINASFVIATSLVREFIKSKLGSK
jgi:hypothetical protein